MTPSSTGRQPDPLTGCRSVHPDVPARCNPTGSPTASITHQKSGVPRTWPQRSSSPASARCASRTNRIVVADARNKRDGRSIETIGEYHPKSDPSIIKVDGDRAAYWLGVGAQPTEAVAAILKVTGDWQKFKGLPAPAPMLLPAEKPNKRALFDAALSEAGGDTTETGGAATTPRKRAAKKAAPSEADAEPTDATASAEAPAESGDAAQAAAATSDESAGS